MKARERIVDFWKSFNNKGILAAMINFESIGAEVYILTEEQDAALEAVFLDIDSKKKLDYDIETILRLMDALPVPYLLYFLQLINRKDRDFSSQIIKHSQANRSKGAHYDSFYHRSQIFEIVQMASRIFMTDRINKIISLMG